MIMFSTYEKHSDWMLAVVKFKNAFFLCECVTEQQKKEQENMTSEHRAFCHYGHKFEDYVTKSRTFQREKRRTRQTMDLFLDANTEEIIDPSKQFTGVFQSTIDRYQLVYGAEMDCVLENSSTNKEHIELKVCAGKSFDDLKFQL